MCTFIEDYLDSPSAAIARAMSEQQNRFNDIDENLIYQQLASPEFRLYEDIILT
jgi:hypothetical protein